MFKFIFFVFYVIIYFWILLNLTDTIGIIFFIGCLLLVPIGAGIGVIYKKGVLEKYPYIDAIDDIDSWVGVAVFAGTVVTIVSYIIRWISPVLFCVTLVIVIIGILIILRIVLKESWFYKIYKREEDIGDRAYWDADGNYHISVYRFNQKIYRSEKIIEYIIDKEMRVFYIGFMGAAAGLIYFFSYILPLDLSGFSVWEVLLMALRGYLIMCLISFVIGRILCFVVEYILLKLIVKEFDKVFTTVPSSRKEAMNMLNITATEKGEGAFRHKILKKLNNVSDVAT